jgi:uncharacterized protein YgbK (DUF1537 family)
MRGGIRRACREAGLTMCVIDDDPTGTQTVHRVPVYMTWDVDTLREAMGFPVFFLSVNTRSLPEAEAGHAYYEIGRNLRHVLGGNLSSLRVASRSDSTLRGYFPLDVDALGEGLELHPDGIILMPAFFEGGRYTIGAVQWVERDGMVEAAHDTEFAKDPDFGYASAYLPSWVEEKSGGRWRASEVVRIGLAEIRAGSRAPLLQMLDGVSEGRVAVVDAACDADIERFVVALHEVEMAGKVFLYRVAASFAKVRAGIPDCPMLSGAVLGKGRGPGLVIVGSYVDKTTRQVDALLKCPGAVPIEFEVGRVVDSRDAARAVAEAAQSADATLRRGETPVLYTSRARLDPGEAGFLDTGRKIMDALCHVVARLTRRPAFVIAKGGITSYEIAKQGLTVGRANVLGPIAPGVPVWELGPGSRLPGTPYVVFPGNVGADESLAQVYRKLTQEE